MSDALAKALNKVESLLLEIRKRYEESGDIGDIGWVDHINLFGLNQVSNLKSFYLDEVKFEDAMLSIEDAFIFSPKHDERFFAVARQIHKAAGCLYEFPRFDIEDRRIKGELTKALNKAQAEITNKLHGFIQGFESRYGISLPVPMRTVFCFATALESLKRNDRSILSKLRNGQRLETEAEISAFESELSMDAYRLPRPGDSIKIYGMWTGTHCKLINYVAVRQNGICVLLEVNYEESEGKNQKTKQQEFFCNAELLDYISHLEEGIVIARQEKTDCFGLPALPEVEKSKIF